MHEEQGPTAAGPVGEGGGVEQYTCILEASDQPSEEVDYSPPRPARVTDLGRGRLRLVFHERFEPGTLVTVGRETTADTFLPPLQVRVVSVTPQADGQWAVDCLSARSA